MSLAVVTVRHSKSGNALKTWIFYYKKKLNNASNQTNGTF